MRLKEGFYNGDYILQVTFPNYTEVDYYMLLDGELYWKDSTYIGWIPERMKELDRIELMSSDRLSYIAKAEWYLEESTERL